MMPFEKCPICGGDLVEKEVHRDKCSPYPEQESYRLRIDRIVTVRDELLGEMAWMVNLALVLYHSTDRRHKTMKSVQVELSETLAAELEALVQAGWFRSEDELVRLALVEFVQRHRFELLERFQREDIAWALQQQKAID